MKFKPWQETLSSSRSLFKVLPSSFLSPTRFQWLLLSGCGTVKMQHQVPFVLQAVFSTVHANCLRWGHGRSTRLPHPRDGSPKGRVANAAALSHKETCVAISVQLKDLSKTLFRCCHSFFWTFTFCCLVADRRWIWCRSLGGVKGHWKGRFTNWPFWAYTAITYLACPWNQAWILYILPTLRAWATAVHRIPTLYLLTDFWWTFLFDAFLAST